MTIKLDVDCFEIDIETLCAADWSRDNWMMEQARIRVIQEVIKNLTVESKERFNKYQEEKE